jgi:hypothetical protein
MTLAAGDYFPGAKVEYMKQGSTVAIAKGKLLQWDTSGDGWLACAASTAALGPYAVCVEATSTGATQVKVCYGGLVAVTGSGVIEPNDLCVPSTSTAGSVMTWAARSSNLANAMSEYRRPCGQMKASAENEGDGAIAGDTAAGDVFFMNLREGI